MESPKDHFAQTVFQNLNNFHY